MGKPIKFLDFAALSDKCAKFSDVHIWRLSRSPGFPKPIRITNRNLWVESEIDQYIAQNLAQRATVAA
jgi:predicted DNA-binding transcriptional regulator AlpA